MIVSFQPSHIDNPPISFTSPPECDCPSGRWFGWLIGGEAQKSFAESSKTVKDELINDPSSEERKRQLVRDLLDANVRNGSGDCVSTHANQEDDKTDCEFW
jgi:hypothetical protein